MEQARENDTNVGTVVKSPGFKSYADTCAYFSQVEGSEFTTIELRVII